MKQSTSPESHARRCSDCRCSRKQRKQRNGFNDHEHYQRRELVVEAFYPQAPATITSFHVPAQSDCFVAGMNTRALLLRTTDSPGSTQSIPAQVSGLNGISCVHRFRLHRCRSWDFGVPNSSALRMADRLGLQNRLHEHRSSYCSFLLEHLQLPGGQEIPHRFRPPEHPWHHQRRSHLDSRGRRQRRCRLSTESHAPTLSIASRSVRRHRAPAQRSSLRRMAVKRGRHNPFRAVIPVLSTESPARPTRPATQSGTTSSQRPMAESPGRTLALPPGAPRCKASAASPLRAAPPSGARPSSRPRTVAVAGPTLPPHPESAPSTASRVPERSTAWPLARERISAAPSSPSQCHPS